MTFEVNFGKRLVELGFGIVICFILFVWYHFNKDLKEVFK